MRTVVLGLLLVTSLVSLPPAAAKAFLEDAAGDTALSVVGQQTVPLATAQTDNVDLLSLDIIEDEENLNLVLSVKSLQQSATFSEYLMRFTWRESTFRAVVQRISLPGVLEESTEAYLVDEEESDWERIAWLDHTMDVQKGVITVALPKVYVMDSAGRMPLQGEALRDVHVEAYQHLTVFDFTMSAYDRMPDEGEQDYSILVGDVQAGHLRLLSDERVRVSNGGATTFVYQATIKSTADFEDEVALELRDLPEGWNGTVQSPIRVPADGERRIAVLMSVPFEHVHGGYSSFNLTATSSRDLASSAVLRMGVLHTPIPQPAGHHQELYLHGESFDRGIFSQLFSPSGGWINTDSAHDSDIAEIGPSDRDSDALEWHIPLNPGLKMGLDFDVEQLGSIAGAIVGHAKAEATVSAELLLQQGLMTEEEGQTILLATSDDAPVTLDLSAPSPFALTLTPTEDADYIPHAKGQNLWLVLRLKEEGNSVNWICCIGETSPSLTTADFLMQLPLNEYHDRLTGLAEAAELVELKAEGAVEKAGLPGSVMTYAFTVTNRGTRAEVFDIDVAGGDAALGTVVPSGAVDLDAKESRSITLAVAIPQESAVGEELEVLVFVHSQEDPGKMSIARTKTTVAKGIEALPDESEVLTAAQEAENETPAPGAFLALAVLALAALVWRRR